MDTFAFVEHGGMDMLSLDGRRGKQFLRVEDPVLLNRDAAAEMAQAFINIRAKYSPESPIHTTVNGTVELTPERPVLGRGTTSADVLAYLTEHGPQSRRELVDAFAIDTKTMGNRLTNLTANGRIHLVDGRWTARKNRKKGSSATSREVYDWIAANGPKTYHEIREHFNFSSSEMSSRIYYLNSNAKIIEGELGFTTVGEPPPGTGKYKRVGEQLWPDAEPPDANPPEMRRVSAMEVYDYIVAHPGQTAGQIREGLGVETRAWKSAIDALRHRKNEHFHIDPATGGYHPGEGPELTPVQRANIARAVQAGGKSAAAATIWEPDPDAGTADA